jgi:hypothetical protein
VRTRVRCGLLFLTFLFAGSAWAANNPVPQLDQPIAPMSAVPGGPGFTLTVRGAGFVSGSVVNWNGSPRPTTFVDAGKITAAIPASDIISAGTATIMTTNPSPGGGTSNPVFFEISNPQPDNPAFTSVVRNNGANGLGPVITADFNGDGKLDVVYQSGDLFLLLGNGDGSFQAPLTYPLSQALGGNTVSVLLAADFNRDGKMDLAVITAVPGLASAYILLGNGDGTFQPAQQIPGPLVYRPSSIVAADFNGDGNVDLLIGGQFHQNPSGAQFAPLVLFLGNGDGTFSTGTNVSINVSIPGPLAIGDFNGDGLLDIAFLGGIVLGNGDGSFQAPQAISMGAPNTPPQSMIAADVNGDGKLDLVLGLYSAGVGIMMGNGDGTFQSSVNYPSGPNSGCPCIHVVQLAAADLNGDGKLDLLADLDSSATTSPLWMLLGNGDGTFQSPITYSLHPFSDIGDFNNDGKMDFVTVTDGPVNAGQNALIFYLQGQLPLANVAPATLDFSTKPVGITGVPQAVTLTNPGPVSLTISSVSIEGTNAGDFGFSNSCSLSLAPNATCEISITFTPASSGPRSAALAIVDNAPGSPHTVPLTGAGQDFSVDASGAASATITAGQTANYTLAIAPAGGFSKLIALSCSGGPAQSTCMVTPTSLQLNGTSPMMATVTVMTAAKRLVLSFGPDARSRVNYRPVPQISALLGTFVMVVGLVLLRRGLRLRWALPFALAALVCLDMTLTSCGGGSQGSGGSNETQAGTYTITVSGIFTSGSTTLTHTAKLTLVVQ